ncbi:DUF4270 domain-containing protein [Flavobacteriales bacterium]|jgi:hypothetical protein|nr:DUF4270 domain-containing protein [Flavobacteriales bacterium]
MNILKQAAYLIVGTAILACNDPNVVGINLPDSAKFTINNDSIENFVLTTVVEDSLRSDESINLLLGQITEDPIFGENTGAFCQQMLLPANNIEEISNIVVDSVFMTYTYSDYYGDLNENDLEISVYELVESIYKDSIYYSDYTPIYNSTNLAVNKFIIEGDSNSSSYFKIQLSNSFGEQIINASGSDDMIDDEAFLEFFKGFYVEATASNTIMYLNPIADKSRFSIFYHEIDIDTAISFDCDFSGDAARINIFNKKTIDTTLNPDYRYIQSMGGHKIEFIFTDLPSIQQKVEGKAINRVTVDLKTIEDNNYASHEKLFLVRETNEGKIVFLTDFTIEGESHFGGELKDGIYSFNITRYFVQLLNNPEYTDKLYILSSGAAANANRTILDYNKININIIFTEI